MIWNSSGEREDCLHLNIWAPEDTDALPGSPNGEGLPDWPYWGTSRAFMRLKAEAFAEPESDRERFEFLESLENR